MHSVKKAVNLERLNELVSLGFDRELVAETLRRNKNDIDKSLDDLTNPETNAAIQRDTDERKKRRNLACIEKLLSMGFERSLVVEAQGGEQAIDQLLRDATAYAANNTGNDPIPNNAAPEGMNILDNLGSNNGDTGGPSAGHIVEDRDIEMEDEIALSDYDIDVTNEGEAINEYFALLDSADSTNTVNKY